MGKERGLTSEDMSGGFVFAGNAAEILLPFRGVKTNTDGEAEYCDSGKDVGITTQDQVIGERVSAKAKGFWYLELNGAAGGTITPRGMIKYTTDGIGVLADTDKDQVNARLAEDADVTTDGYVARVERADFTLSV